MRRLVAFAIDFYIFSILFSIVMVNYRIKNIITISQFVIVVNVGNAFFCLYNFVCDLAFSGTTIGKYFAKIRLCRGTGEGISFKFALSHSLLKQLYLMTSWIGLIIYLLNGNRAPYDRFLNITIREVGKEE